MIILKITEKGHYIEIPGMSPFRTPADANISHVSIPLVVARLQSQGIKKFEIVSDTQGKASVLTQNDFKVGNKNPKKKKEVNYEKRVGQLESMMKRLLEKEASNATPDQEQITNKLSTIEKLLKNRPQTNVVHVTEKKTKKIGINREPVIEEIEDTFIPDINLDGLEVKGKGSRESIKQDKLDIDDSADLLSRIMQPED
jgi:hypothetical protein